MTSIHLNRSVTILHTIAFSIGAIVGWGCFIMPSEQILPISGPMGGILGILIGCGFVLFVALNYGLLIRFYPKAGGTFFYCLSTSRTKLAFYCGWALIACYLALIAINLSSIPIIFRYFTPGTLQNTPLYTFNGWKIYLEEVLISSAVIISFAVLNLRGMEFSGSIQSILAISLTLGIIVTFVLVVGSQPIDPNNLRPFFNPDSGPISSILYVTSISPFLFIGFDCITQIAEEFKFKPSKAKNLMLLSIFIGAIIYILAILIVALPIPYPQLLEICASNKEINGSAWGFALVSGMTLGKISTFIILFPILGAVLTGVNGYFVVCSRLIFSMSREGFLPKKLSYIRSRSSCPVYAVFLVTALSIASILLGRHAVILSVEITSVCACFGYLASCICVMSTPDYKNSIVLRITNYFALLYSLVCFALLLLPFSGAQISSISFIMLTIWFGIGVIIHFMFRHPSIHTNR